MAAQIKDPSHHEQFVADHLMRALRNGLREMELLGTRVGSEGLVLNHVPGLPAFQIAADRGPRRFRWNPKEVSA